MRIHVWIAKHSMLSRRKAEKLVEQGKVIVNDHPAVIGQKVIDSDRVVIDGNTIEVINLPTRLLALHKPVGYVCSHQPQGEERSVDELLPKLENKQWVYVGRLDINTSGLLLVTTDGQLANEIGHPSKGFTRVYRARVSGKLSPKQLDILRSGVELDDGIAKCLSIKQLKNQSGGRNTWYEMTLGQGRYRMVRRLFESQDVQVNRLIRTAFGPIQLSKTHLVGHCDEIDVERLNQLMNK